MSKSWLASTSGRCAATARSLEGSGRGGSRPKPPRALQRPPDYRRFRAATSHLRASFLPSSRGGSEGRASARRCCRPGRTSQSRVVWECSPKRVGVKPLRGKRLGSARSARGIQPDGHGSSPPVLRVPPSTRPTPLGRQWRAGAARRLGFFHGRRRAHFLRGAPPRLSPHSGAADESPPRLLCPPLGAGLKDGPSARRGCRPGRTVLSPPPDRAAPPWAGTGPRNGRSGSAAMPATQPTRLETRTKESNARASQRARRETPRRNESEGSAPRRPRWDPRLCGRWRTTARLPPAGEVEQERARWYPKDGELCPGRAKPEETLVEARSGPDVQIGRPTWV
ncbi:hypothetical protein HF521_011831 [Silurus meridionalis]|uniref:Uncharacterized protein n=1 Tax=Silurus meridionalis TaxID=175797 RepID=A0A8T0ACQ0_SILME|nr:hypothetical protein HF521_011831 [Silurus meridionalis]